MHPRVSLNLICFPSASAVEDDLEACRAAGLRQVGISVAKLRGRDLGALSDLLRSWGMSVATVLLAPLFLPDQPDRWAEREEAACEALEIAAALSASNVYGTVGPAGSLTWEEAAAAVGAASVEVIERSRALGVPLLIESTLPVYAETSFVHSLSDAVDLAAETGLGVVVDFFHVWSERGLQETFRRGVAHIGMAQVGDYVVGAHDYPCRVVPGDGDLHLRQQIGWLLDAGFEGTFDLELRGPRIDEEGPASAGRRSAEALSAILDELGA
ncbi:MAG: sugar phosphate isomerase/epimerase [Acidobacteria bacterium]|nr:sugar phosphate isomerase/epimerase [Acidobacteriota bacterium]